MNVSFTEATLLMPVTFILNNLRQCMTSSTCNANPWSPQQSPHSKLPLLLVTAVRPTQKREGNTKQEDEMGGKKSVNEWTVGPLEEQSAFTSAPSKEHTYSIRGFGTEQQPQPKRCFKQASASKQSASRFTYQSKGPEALKSLPACLWTVCGESVLSDWARHGSMS